MGSWQLEVAKMFFYVMVPIGAFYVFNQPEIFQDLVSEAKIQAHREPSGDRETFQKLKEECQQIIKDHRNKQNRILLNEE